jgi:hypothetical protein
VPEQLGGMQASECAAPPPDRRPDRFDDDGSAHSFSSRCLRQW